MSLLELLERAKKEDKPLIYVAEFRREHAVIPAMAGLPRIIRAFIGA